MKNRVLLTMLILFIVLSSIWITCGTIFVVRHVEIVDSTVTAERLTDEEVNEIVNQCGLLGKNILFNLHDDEVAESIKTVNPMIKLQTVTAKFPNRVVLEVSRRVPVYYDGKNEKCFDAEMCVVDTPLSSECVDISGANLELAREDFMCGDVVSGKDDRSQCKIEQLKVIATSGCFESLDGFKISYDDDDSLVGANRLYLILKINEGVTFKIKVKPEENFLHALDYTVQYYKSQNKINGVYETVYDEIDNKLKTKRSEK